MPVEPNVLPVPLEEGELLLPYELVEFMPEPLLMPELLPVSELYDEEEEGEAAELLE